MRVSCGGKSMCKGPEVEREQRFRDQWKARCEAAAALGTTSLSWAHRTSLHKWSDDEQEMDFWDIGKWPWLCLSHELNCKPFEGCFSIFVPIAPATMPSTEWVLSWCLWDVKSTGKSSRSGIWSSLSFYWFSLGPWPSHAIGAQLLLDEQKLWEGL